MPLDLSPECRKRLREALTVALPMIGIRSGIFPDWRSGEKLAAAERALPQNGKLHDRLIEYLDERPLTEFILGTLGRELWERDKYQGDEQSTLAEIEGYHDAEVLAVRLLDQFESLPWEYQITVPLPDSLVELLRPAESAVELSPSIRLVRATEEFAKEFSLAAAGESLNRRLAGGPSLMNVLARPTPKWTDGAVCVQIAAEGFIDQFGTSGTSNTAGRLLRSLLGMGLATHLLDSNLTVSATPQKSFAYVHRRKSDGAWHAMTRYDLDDSVSRGIANLKVRDLEGILEREHKPGSVSGQLSDISAAFRAGRRAEPTILAAQWLFDSYARQHPLLSFVQSMVVLEIILGDKSVSDEIGIGELISNRFAYLVGTTHDERTNLIADFKKIYQVRSQIVHSGKHTLTFSERALSWRLKWMCHRAIGKEIELLKAGINKQLPLDIGSLKPG
jgi:hypothetical protein